MTDVSTVAENMYLIDNRLFSIPKWGSVYVIDEEKKALIECGPTTSIPFVLGGLREIGVQPEAIDYLIVTHIHLDHSGGAGTLLRSLPNAQVIVHPKGARHLIHPERLVAAATATRGDEVIDMHGEVVPVPESRVKTVGDGETLSLGDKQTLTFIDTPGHAPHHICIHESRHGGIFTGDALALYNAACDILLPFHPPTQFDLEQCLHTFEKLEGYSPKHIYYSHFGVSSEVRDHFARARQGLLDWDTIAKKSAATGSAEKMREQFIENGYARLEPMKGIPSLSAMYDYFLHRSIPMAAEGHLEYYRTLLKQK
jgi:glyoxylase-like metal-dependent hydrolase (beta-lactamase superfamily II)